MDEIGERAWSAGGAPRKPRTSRPAFPPRTSSSASCVGERRDPEACLADQLGEDAARPERDERPEDGILDDAGEELGAALDHRLDDTGAPMRAAAARTACLVAEVEREPAELGLVRAGGGGLDDDREAELAGGRNGLVGRFATIRSGTSGRP